MRLSASVSFSSKRSYCDPSMPPRGRKRKHAENEDGAAEESNSVSTFELYRLFSSGVPIVLVRLISLVAPALLCQSHANIDFVEAFAGSQRVTSAFRYFKYVGVPFDVIIQPD